ncbi:MAG: 4-hydroxy-3-methylbut-2-enyl diphosphate reductase [Ferruginibacter sp.]
MKKFDVPIIYRSPLIAAIKNKRKAQDKMKKDFRPTLLDYGPLKIYLARHFGFCYGVENAIEIAFRTIEENPGKRIFLLSEMIHNPQVNADLLAKGVQFLQDTYGKQVIPFETLTKDDVVIIPAFGTTLDIEDKLTAIGIETYKYNTTCPFVEKVWNRSEQIAKKNYTVVVHGKPTHEETRATFSHASANTPTLIVNDIEDAILLGKYISGEKDSSFFNEDFQGKFSGGFDVNSHLQRIGVVNQTTMLASDTQEISDYLKQVMAKTYQLDDTDIEQRFADTRDTLCYATNDNQSAVYGLLEKQADLAIVVGGYNSSNTTHLVELCEAKLPTYFINNEEKLLPGGSILHYHIHSKKEQLTEHFLSDKKPVTILMTSGASCPDALVEGIINKLKSMYAIDIPDETVLEELDRYQ